MKETREIMGMPVVVEITDAGASPEALEKIFDYFQYVDATFSTYKKESEISRINRGEVQKQEYSDDMQLILKLAFHTWR